jgi:hypothetical protein
MPYGRDYENRNWFERAGERVRDFFGGGHDYDRDFGGVQYLFLRGMHPDWRDADGHPHGVFASRPPRVLVEALDRCFGGPVPAQVAA